MQPIRQIVCQKDSLIDFRLLVAEILPDLLRYFGDPVRCGMLEVPYDTEGLVPVMIRHPMLATKHSGRRVLLLVFAEVAAAEREEALDGMYVSFWHFQAPLNVSDCTRRLRNTGQDLADSGSSGVYRA